MVWIRNATPPGWSSGGGTVLSTLDGRSLAEGCAALSEVKALLLLSVQSLLPASDGDVITQLPAPAATPDSRHHAHSLPSWPLIPLE